nr:adenylate kinase [Eubacterium sp.]
MIVLIAGASHTGKTNLAQKLLEKYQYPYLSIDHLKMGLIRSGYTNLTVEDDEELTEYMWPIVREMIKTAIENNQSLVIEGGYIPYDWEKSFDEEYRKHICYVCLVMSKEYIKNHYEAIKKYASVVEERLDDSGCTKEWLLRENQHCLEMCEKHGCKYVWIDEAYEVEQELEKVLKEVEEK